MSLLDNEDILVNNHESIIIEWLKKNCLIFGDYYVKDDEIYVDGDVEMGYKDAKPRPICKIPYKFKEVNGNFICNEYLTSLDNCPEKVTGDFSCRCGSALKTLKGCPAWVGGDFDCIGGAITSLKYHPKFIGGNLCLYSCDKLFVIPCYTPDFVKGVISYKKYDYIDSTQFLPAHEFT